MVRISLIALPNPTLTDPRIAPPLGLLYLAGYLKKHGYNNIQVINLAFQELPDIDADIIGVSVSSTQVAYANQYLERLSSLYPNSIIVVGGPHPTTLPNDLLCDFAVVGEGEQAFLDIVSGDAVDTVVCRDYITDIDDIPFPARELIDFKEYTRTIGGKPATNMITSRGCPARCIFCDQDVWQNKLRFHSAEHVLGEIDDIKAKTGIDRILFLDDTLTFNRERILEICEGLKKRGVLWRGWTRASCIDRRLLKVMKDSGCQSLCIGVESGSDTILKNLHKGTTVAQNLKAIKIIKEAGMYARASIMIGSPGETPDTVAETKDFMAAAKPDDWIVSTFVPVVGSPAWKEPGKYGIRITDKDYANYFVVGYDQQSGLVFEQDSMSKDELIKQRKELIEWLTVNVPRKPEKVVQ